MGIQWCKHHQDPTICCIDLVIFVTSAHIEESPILFSFSLSTGSNQIPPDPCLSCTVFCRESNDAICLRIRLSGAKNRRFLWPLPLLRKVPLCFSSPVWPNPTGSHWILNNLVQNLTGNPTVQFVWGSGYLVQRSRGFRDPYPKESSFSNPFSRFIRINRIPPDPTGSCAVFHEESEFVNGFLLA